MLSHNLFKVVQKLLILWTHGPSGFPYVQMLQILLGRAVEIEKFIASGH